METKLIDRIHSILKNLKSVNSPEQHPLFSNILDISVSRFLDMHVNFMRAVNYWPGLLAKILAKLKYQEDRIIILENINGEHGNGDIEKSHVSTYYKFLQSLKFNGTITTILNSESSSTSVDSFIEDLEILIDNFDGYELCLIFGAIEYLYMDVRRYINQYLKFHNLGIYHYKINEEIDYKHSENLFNIFVKNIKRNKEEKTDEELLELLYAGYKLLYSYYENLYNEYVKL